VSDGQNRRIQRVFRPQFSEQPNRELFKRKAGKSFSKTGNFYLFWALPRRRSAAILAALTGMICPRSPAAMIKQAAWVLGTTTAP
jgi:hypothetical protein